MSNSLVRDPARLSIRPCLNQFRRWRVRHDTRVYSHEAFFSLACTLICWQSLLKTWATE